MKNIKQHIISFYNYCGIGSLVFSGLFFVINSPLLYEDKILKFSLQSVFLRLSMAIGLLSIPILWCNTAIALNIYNHNTANQLRVGKACVLISFLIVAIFIILFTLKNHPV